MCYYRVGLLKIVCDVWGELECFHLYYGILFGDVVSPTCLIDHLVELQNLQQLVELFTIQCLNELFELCCADCDK